MTGDVSDKVYVVQTAAKAIQRCLLMTTDPGDVVIDPTCGSGTTAYVAEQWGRRWITIDSSRVSLTLARTRLLAGRFPYYLLSDSSEGIKKEAEISGTGILPVSRRRGVVPTGDTTFQGVGTHAQDERTTRYGQDARATAWDADHGEVSKRWGAYLPHWTAEDATYSVTFRLADSLPKTVLDGFVRERDEIVRRATGAGRKFSPTEEQRLRELFSEKVERFLDAGHGACVLKDDRIALVIRDALSHFDGKRYVVLAWCVMPNHVHVIVRPRPERPLSDIMHSWKSYTANSINRTLGCSGPLWQAEYFDHLIRNAEDGERSVAYVLANPEAAGLTDWKWCGTSFTAVAEGAGGGSSTVQTHGQDARATNHDIRKGFVYERVPHIMLKGIANNEEIDSIHAEWQEKLEPIRAKLNKATKQKWEEWQVPRLPANDLNEDQATEDWDAIGIKEESSGAKLLVEWWELRRKRQKEIDESIARRADSEILYDKPYQDNKRVRVTGPFTVESLSPHRTISAAEKKEQAEVGSGGRTLKTYGPDKFGALVLENLRTAGVQNTFKNERLKFDSLQPYAGQWIQGEGHFAEADGTNKRAAICIGPEHGTVGALLIKEAAKEAVQGVGFDMLIVCGFAFDAAVGDEAKRYGKLVVLPTKMNPDLAMGELLKKTGSGNLFMVFGEPDVDVATGKDGKVTVEISGLDVYDPTTGEVRSSSTDDIACWFIDTNYNGESFFVRHAYFTGADEPYDKLKRALRAEIDEAAWSDLYSTKSRPFAKPETGKIAIKVINHYGDEVMKVYRV